RFRVERRTEKICDTVEYNKGSLNLPNTVLLADLRCDGSAHRGCQAECRIFWKEAWLRKVTEATAPSPSAEPRATQALLDRVSRDLVKTVEIKGRMQEVWRCQSTELQRCTQRVRTFDPRPYVRELTCGNVSFGHFLSTTSRAVIAESSRK